MKFNIHKPYEDLDQTPIGPNFVRQNGLIYGWSESNCYYDLAWWLYVDLKTCDPATKLNVERLMKERPLPPGVKP